MRILMTMLITSVSGCTGGSGQVNHEKERSGVATPTIKLRNQNVSMLRFDAMSLERP